jgi:hypothetical protein
VDRLSSEATITVPVISLPTWPLCRISWWRETVARALRTGILACAAPADGGLVQVLDTVVEVLMLAVLNTPQNLPLSGPHSF